MPRPILATILPSAIAHNLKQAKRAAPQAHVWGVIKANAYGHGIERVYAGLAQADGLAMLDFDEAARVRALGWTKPVLMLEGCFDATDLAQCSAMDLTPVVHSMRQLQAVLSSQQALKVYIKVNTGMNRLGFAPSDLETVAQCLMGAKHITVAAWMSHFANADEPAGGDIAMAQFLQAMQTLFAKFPTLQAPFSLSNSAAINMLPAAHFDSVRAGIMMYGSSPTASASAKTLNLKPAMVLSSQIIGVQTVQAGDSVGYGSTFTAHSAMRIGIVACGYADGYPRHAPTGTPIVVDGVRTQTIGRVSMDMLAVDLSPVPNSGIGSAVELWGEQVSIDEVAHAAGTIGYELMCALALRVPTQIGNELDHSTP